MKAYFEALAGQYPAWSLARVTAQEKGLYRIALEDGEATAEVSGKYRFEAASPLEYPAVGDYVMVSCPEGGGSAMIHKLLERKSVFVRRAAGTGKQEQVVAANIDLVFLCMSLNKDYNLRRLERYLSVAYDSGAKPVVVLTKADLCSDAEERRTEVESIALGADVIVSSSLEEEGLTAILPYLQKDVTASFIGSSGVGKSTMINRLIGRELLATGGLRNDDKGRHTTTHRELITLNSGATLIDTPGMRELGLWGADEGLDTAFADIESLAAGCRFKNCSHTSEPGCAVKAAIEAGELSWERFASYSRLSKENAYAKESRSFLAAKEKKFKQIAKLNKSNKKR